MSNIDIIELKKFLKENNFKDINDDDVFESKGIVVFIYSEGSKDISITFAHSENGYRSIDNPTFEQIKKVVDVFKESVFHEQNYENIKQRYSSIILNEFKKHLQNN